jgi:predicted negative regulator of RcsB-dependent stress response
MKAQVRNWLQNMKHIITGLLLTLMSTVGWGEDEKRLEPTEDS